jgi:LCP family protein required for cell wall assembly
MIKSKIKKILEHKAARIVLGVLSVFIAIVLVVGTVLAVFYKSGEASLKASASTDAPTVEEETKQAKVDFVYGNTVAWQDDWVVYNDEVYTYNKDTLNFILLGIDTHGEMSTQEDLVNREAGQADAVFLISLNPKDKIISVVCIPRNSMVDIEIIDEEEQITGTFYNELCLQYPYAGGGELGLTKMKERVSEIFSQLPIHGACAINLDAIGVIVDMLGGIEVTIPEDLTKLNPSYVEGSTLKLTKENAWLYLKYRDTSVMGSPITRLTRQREFLQIAINVAIEQVKSNPLLVSDIYNAIIEYMNTDITLDEAVYLSKQSLDYSITSDSFYQLTGEERVDEYIRKDGTSFSYDNCYLDEDVIKDVLMEVFYTQVVIDEAN